MATYKPVGETVRHPVAPTLRGAFLKALELKGGKSGMTLAEIILELIETEGMLAVMDRVAKFQERVGTLDVQHSGEVTSLVSVLTGLAPGTGHDTAVESEPGSVRH